MSYTDAELRAGQRAMILEGGFSRAMEGVTGGVILAGFALALGATDLEIGLIAAIPFLAQLAHLPAVALLARFPDRRPLAVGAALAARLLFIAMAAVPFMSLPLRPVHALVPLLVAYATLATVGGAGWQVWVRELVPRDVLGRYFGRRMAILSFVGLVTVVLGGQFVQWHARAFPGQDVRAFAILFAFGGVAGVASALILATAPSHPSTAGAGRPLGKALRAPLVDPNYRRVLVFLGAWGFAANIALPFVSVVLLRHVGYGVGTVTTLAAVSQLANILGLKLWAPLTDRFGNKPILGLSASVFFVGMGVWTFTPKELGTSLLVAAAIAHVFLGFAIAGLDIASNGVVMKLAPDDDVPSYLASASVVKAVAAGVAPLLGGLVATLLAGQTFRMQFVWSHGGGDTIATAVRFIPHDWLFLASLVLGLYAVHRLLGFQEEGEAPPERVVRAMRREIGAPSSIAGMRTFAHVAGFVVDAAYRMDRAIEAPSRAIKRRRDDDEPPDAKSR